MLRVLILSRQGRFALMSAIKDTERLPSVNSSLIGKPITLASPNKGLPIDTSEIVLDSKPISVSNLSNLPRVKVLTDVVEDSKISITSKTIDEVKSTNSTGMVQSTSAQPKVDTSKRLSDGENHAKPQTMLRRAQLVGEDLVSWLTGVTGYKAIQALKHKEAKFHAEFLEAQSQLQTFTDEYERAVEQRSRTQMKLNKMLSGRLEWTPEDAQTFAQLNKDEKVLQAAVAKAQEALDTCMSAVSESQSGWLRVVEQHRHEELAYLENGRQLGTYASLILLSFHTLLFIINFLILEPYKERRRLRRIEELLAVQSGEVWERLEEARPRGEQGPDTGTPPALSMQEVVQHLQAIEERRQESERQVDAQLLEISDLVKGIENANLNSRQSVDIQSPFQLGADGSQLLGVACIVGVVSGALCVALTSLLGKR